MAWLGFAGWLAGWAVDGVTSFCFFFPRGHFLEAKRERGEHASVIHSCGAFKRLGWSDCDDTERLSSVFIFFPFPLPRLLPPPYYSATFTDVHHGVNRFVYFYVLFYSVLFSFCCCLPCTSRTDGHATMGWETMGGYNIGCITTIHNDGSRRTSLEIMGNNRTAVGYNRAPTLIRWRLAPRCLRQKSSEKAHRWLIKGASIVCR